MKFTDVQKMLDNLLEDDPETKDDPDSMGNLMSRQNEALMKIRDILHNTPEQKPELLVFVKIENILDECEKEE